MYKIDFDSPCHVHFIGIGGISMSGLAEILNNAGFTISGSDIKPSETTKILEEKGIRVLYGQVKENVDDSIDLVVYTAAISETNEEFVEVKRRNIPMLTRAQLLGQIMYNYKYSIAISGTHGKTTTTSMMSYVLLNAKKDPTISIGGMLDLIGGNIRIGNSDYFVTEACEYTNSYHSFNPFISIILNVDADHLDFFKTIENIANSFKVFAEKLPNDGLLVVNGDMKYYDHVTKDLKCNIITFGFDEKNDYRAADISINEAGQVSYDLYIKGEKRCRVELSITGEHNAMNSLSVIAVALYLGIDLEDILEGLRKCNSAKRRFEYKGTLPQGTTVIDDYAHHPTEIAATLKVANAVKKGELYVAFQPHTYSRTYDHLVEFADVLTNCDHLILADIYAAREPDNGLVHSKDIVKMVLEKGTDAVYLGSYEAINEYVKKNCKKNDLLITMGAGPIDSAIDFEK